MIEQWELWEARFRQFLEDEGSFDVAHPLEHIERVVANAKRLASAEQVGWEVIVPAAWLHDCVTVPKSSPLRKEASRLSAEKAISFLQSIDYPTDYLAEIGDSILTHSFSAALAPRTLAAKIVQDADRLDALGAIGIARCLMLGGEMGRALYHSAEPFPIERVPDDSCYTIDHFFTELLRLAPTMQTAAGREEADRRTQYMIDYLQQLGRELGVSAEISLVQIESIK